ncbi:MAG: ABC transporter substrate-binding protein [gamma proteobacterium symbiont of Lucinoma myriamae]|nr:ABC transporter substrate-binding protein [gamma proteobacterium symbiont of Lucinoma myriamae]MCU7818701.1 ABC transporter substrate-binding protein [gamma proteobacterium symbiont of Lucinoma myriamae]MCU7832517.1 ABC transporter substrate-binding protein [gamma proteobacterium symbiont of Lucinoma myriamae]
MLLLRFFNFIFLIIIISMPLLSGCDTQNNEHKVLRIGMNTWPGYEPLMLAKEKGFISKNIKISRVDSATDVIKALRSDLIDVACVTLDEAMMFQATSNEPIKIITIMTFSTGGDALIANKSISSMALLKGKRIGVESSALEAFMLSRAVDLTSGLHINELKIIITGYEHHEKEFQEGNIDAVVTFEPIKTKLLQNRNNHILFDSTQIPGEIIDVMIVKEKNILSKHDALQALINGWYKSIEYINKEPEQSMQMMASYEEISFNEFKTAYHGIKIPTRMETTEFYTNKLSHTITTTEKILLDKKLVHQKIIPEVLYSHQFLEQ